MTIETGEECPLCAEAFDCTDKQFIPCLCGFQICLWCYRKLQESDSPRCLKCRRTYTGEFRLKSGRPSSTDLYAEGEDSGSEGSIKSTGACTADSKHRPAEQTRDLRDIRVIRRDLCYVVGLPLEAVGDETTLKAFDFFGKYGKVVNIIVNRNPNFKAPDKKKSCALYVTFATPEEAKAAIMDLDESFYEGRRLKASYGTTKYCSNFLRKAKCQNRQCFYLHEKGADEDSFTVAEMNQVKETSRGLTCSALLASEFEQAEWKNASNLFGKNRAETIDYFVSDPLGQKRQPFKSILTDVECRRRGFKSQGTETSNLSEVHVGDCKPVLSMFESERVNPSYRQEIAPWSIVMMPPPPLFHSDPIVHPSLQPLGWHCDPPMSEDGCDEDFLRTLLPSALLDHEYFLPHESPSPSIQPGRLLPQAPSALMTSYVTPADQVAFHSSNYFTATTNNSELKPEGPPGFERFSSRESSYHSSPVSPLRQLQYASSADYYSPPPMESNYSQLQMIGMI
eukprot:Gregarina_sp_Poly_1__11160@NODE_908_length_5757_cov_78_501406_g647_i0_p1_GENE_NODE_908_length_5757_cov_78_501406_g647_i0NODE_908_length_5757_cov_78_501406_g647_i0_p1_ORF_typecomplete_len509_score64_70zfRING_4/PF14570_6/1_7e14RRM_1/PF00076_22/2_7e09RRM_5/PF13893_6/0_0018Nup35_RRM_2/PF14605_6/0_023zfUDP/PF14569_6/0_19DUF3408/PF11888_8/0_17zfRING_5/PF14634_6/14_NODE_908_length_5757_cov_78_501406_g647_i024113937